MPPNLIQIYKSIICQPIIRQPVIKSGLFLLYVVDKLERTENPRVGGSIPSLTTSKPFDFVEGLFVYRLNQIESNKIKYRTIRQPLFRQPLIGISCLKYHQP